MLLAAAASCTAAPAVPLQADGLEALAWLAGCWERRQPGGLLEEQWMRPAGGMLVGMSRTVRDGRAVGWEFMRIVEREGAIVYIATPSGQATAEFTLRAPVGAGAIFENPAHDFPQRIIYERGSADSLWARIEGDRGGERRTIEFRMARVECARRG
jgi:hypothetical protein